MKKLLYCLGTLVGAILIFLIAGGVWLMQSMHESNDITVQSEIMIEPGTSGYAIAQQLAKDNIIHHPEIFYGLMRVQNITVHAGEFVIPPHASMMDILDIFKNNKTIQRVFTLSEGLTVKQALVLLQANEYLTGDISVQPKEGSLLPETYHFVRGETRDALLKRMQEAHDKVLVELWEDRDDDLPITTQEEAVILASIVEKETGKAEERKRIAGLFYNRLKINMPLQTDPTVVYAITDKLGHMQGKPLLSKHLQVDSPYNTYKVSGLPPAPIANPGRASLEAVMRPEKHGYFYFVADGTGGHVFGKNLNEHNKNVREWRIIKRKMNK